jgi:hypothetical protein
MPARLAALTSPRMTARNRKNPGRASDREKSPNGSVVRRPQERQHRPRRIETQGERSLQVYRRQPQRLALGVANVQRSPAMLAALHPHALGRLPIQLRRTCPRKLVPGFQDATGFALICLVTVEAAVSEA